jgi:PleD family two-component response regulator
MIGTAQASLIPSFQLITRWRGDAATRKAGRVHPSAGKTIKKVAIVEDELMVAWTIESMLEDLGYEIVGIFAKGEDAIAALQDVAVDLVCMDINLGRGIDGIEARILESAPDAIVIGKPMTQAKLEQAIGSFTGSPSQ